MLRKPKPSRKGLTLLEMSFVTLIGTVILGAGVMAGGYILDEGTAQEEAGTVKALAAGVRKLKTQEGYPTTSQMGPRLHALNLMPPGISHNDGASMRNGWGGTVNILRIGNGGYFGIQYSNVPQNMCKMMTIKMDSSFITAVGNSATDLRPIAAMEPSDVAELCKERLNTVVWANAAP